MKNSWVPALLSIAFFLLPLAISGYMFLDSPFWSGFIIGGLAIFILYCWFVIIRDAVLLHIF